MKKKDENKDKKIDKKVEVKKVSSFKKKKKVKKNITSGIAFVYSTFNNTIISIADENGNVVSWSSAGSKGFKGSRKSTPYAAQVAADDAVAKADALPNGWHRFHELLLVCDGQDEDAGALVLFVHRVPQVSISRMGRQVCR